jgi:hypothetical protein
MRCPIGPIFQREEDNGDAGSLLGELPRSRHRSSEPAGKILKILLSELLDRVFEVIAKRKGSQPSLSDFQKLPLQFATSQDGLVES